MADMEFALAFTGDASGLKAATAEARDAVSSVSDEAGRSTSDINAHSAALEKDAAAARKAADANGAMAREAKKARDEAARAAGAMPSTSRLPSPPASTMPSPRTPGSPASPRVPPSLPPPSLPPANDNAGRGRRQVLGYQLFDMFQGGVSGMPVGMIAAQQLPQVAQLYAGQGGMKEALGDLKVIAAGAASALTPLTVGLGAVAAAAVAGGVAYDGYLASMKEVETAAAGLGRAVAGSSADMEAAAGAGAAAAGISIKAARSMEAQFLATGRIGSEHYEKLIGISKDFAATMGIDADAAGEALSEMFADPAKAAQTLYRQYGLIDAATARHVANLAAQNRVSEAQGALLDALPDKLADAERATTALGRAWQSVTTWASNAIDAAGAAADRMISGPSKTEQIATLEGNLARPRRADGRDNARRAQWQRDLERLRAEQEAERRADEQRRREAQERQTGAAALTIADSSGVNSASQREQQLRNEIAALQAGQGKLGDDSVGEARIAAAIEQKSRALDALINKQSRAAELDRLDIRIANERNPLLRAELEARRTRLQMADQEVSTATIETDAARARNRVIEETVAASRSQIDDMNAEIEIRSSLAAQVAAGAITQADANRLLQEEITLRPLIAAHAIAEGEAKQNLKAVIDGLRQSYADLANAEKQENAQSIIRDQQETLQQLRAEIALVGQSEATRRQALAVLQAEQQIRREGLSTLSQEADLIRRNAAEEAKRRLELEKSTDAWDRYKSAGEGAIDTIFDGLSSGTSLKDIGKDLLKDLTSSFTELALKNPLKNMLFGTNYGTIDDLLSGGKRGGGILSSIFGGETVGAMTVNAATVMVNGGVTGGLGGLLGTLTGGSAANSNGATGSVSLFGKAIQSIESGGNYGALGPVTASGDRAYGAYQVMGANIPGWTKEALGQSLTPSQFLSSATAQDAVFEKIFGGYVGKYGATGAAKAWFGGPGAVGGSGTATDMLGTSVDQYATKFNDAVSRMSGAATNAGGSLGSLSSGLDTASGGLSTFGSGLGKFGQSLASALTSGNGGLASLLGSFTSAGIAAFNGSPQFAAAVLSGTGGLWSSGGYTGPGGVDEPRGIVHAGEVVWSQRDVARAGGPAVVEAMRLGRRGYAAGGVVDVQPLPAVATGGSRRSGGNDNTMRVVSDVRISIDDDGRLTAIIDERAERAGTRAASRVVEEYDSRVLPERIEQHQRNPRRR